MDDMMDQMTEQPNSLVWLGVLLAILGNIFIAVGFLVQKMVHNATRQQHFQDIEANHEKPSGPTPTVTTVTTVTTFTTTTTTTTTTTIELELDPELKPEPEAELQPELKLEPEPETELEAMHNEVLTNHNRDSQHFVTTIQPLKYLAHGKWWIGLLCLCIGEVCNAFAYAFVSGIVVPPLGAFALILIVVLSCFILKEHVSILHWIGVLFVATGVVLVGVYAPRNEIADGPLSDGEIWELIKQPQFYATFISIVIIILGFIILIHVKPSYRTKTPWVLALLSGLIGSIKSRAFKCIAQMARDSLSQNITTALFWVMIMIMIVTIVASIYFINMGLGIFDQAVFLPMYFVIFVSSSVLTYILLYNEFEDPVSGNIAVFSVGLGMILLGAIGLSFQRIPSWCCFPRSDSS